MKKHLNKLTNLYKKGDNAFYVSFFGPFIMGMIHLISILINFDWIVLNYCIFCFLMLLIKISFWGINKLNLKINYLLLGVIYLIIIIAPLMASLVLTILFKDRPTYIFDWLIYGYALYGTVKMTFAVKSITKKNKTNKEFITAIFNIVGALFTIQMMEFALIKTFSIEGDYAMYLIQLFSQGAIFIFVLFMIGFLIYKNIKRSQNSIKSDLF